MIKTVLVVTATTTIGIVGGLTIIAKGAEELSKAKPGDVKKKIGIVAATIGAQVALGTFLNEIEKKFS